MPAFRDNAIDASVLPSLTAEDLKDHPCREAGTGSYRQLSVKLRRGYSQESPARHSKGTTDLDYGDLFPVLFGLGLLLLLGGLLWFGLGPRDRVVLDWCRFGQHIAGQFC
jgi:hypothetical protein